MVSYWGEGAIEEGVAGIGAGLLAQKNQGAKGRRGRWQEGAAWAMVAFRDDVRGILIYLVRAVTDTRGSPPYIKTGRTSCKTKEGNVASTPRP